MNQKIVVLGIISLLMMISFVSVPCTSTLITSYKLKEGNESNIDSLWSILDNANSNPPKPPLMWTEDFSTFHISIPGSPVGDCVYYYIDWGDGNFSYWIGPYKSNETVIISHVWDNEGEYQIKVKGKNQYGESWCSVYGLTLSSEFKFFRVRIGYVDISYLFTIYWKDWDCWIMIDWGDGYTTDWLGPFEPPLLFPFRAWSLPGEYVLRIKLKDMYGNQSDWISLIVTILSLENDPPNEPSILGPMTGKVGEEYEFSFKAIDPDGNNISFFIDWGDGTQEGWIGPFTSGTTITINHTFDKIRIFTLRAKAKDVYDEESPWSNYYVPIPKYLNICFQWFLRMFPLFEYLFHFFLTK